MIKPNRWFTIGCIAVVVVVLGWSLVGCNPDGTFSTAQTNEAFVQNQPVIVETFGAIAADVQSPDYVDMDTGERILAAVQKNSDSLGRVAVGAANFLPPPFNLILGIGGPLLAAIFGGTAVKKHRTAVNIVEAVEFAKDAAGGLNFKANKDKLNLIMRPSGKKLVDKVQKRIKDKAA